MTAGVELSGLSKRFELPGGEVKVFDDLTATFPPSQVTVLLGMSGCGKTTLIRMIAGLESHDSGTLNRPELDQIGMVFQEPRLMPWLTVRNNILFGVKKADANKAAYAHVLELTNLGGFEEAYPRQLSGGMQQRVAIARTLMHDPQMILLDEPFSALDYFTREAMQRKIIDVYTELGKTIVFVTHSVDEAMILGHKIIVLADGGVAAQFDLSAHPYPRDLLTPEFISVKKTILSAIRRDSRKETNHEEATPLPADRRHAGPAAWLGRLRRGIASRR